MWQTIYIIVPKGFAYGCAACTCICPRGTFQRKANAITKGVKCAWCSFSFHQQLVNPTDQKCMHNMATRATRWKTWTYRPSLVILPSVSLLTATWAHRQLAWPTHQHLECTHYCCCATIRLSWTLKLDAAEHLTNTEHCFVAATVRTCCDQQ